MDDKRTALADAILSDESCAPTVSVSSDSVGDERFRYVEIGVSFKVLSIEADVQNMWSFRESSVAVS